ncbi:ATP-binding cassette domain-containing protein [Streptomyces sp. HK10]|uniref:ATP-binding cassette domain-containing protein n=1 Tax=Streptomyces sp. HK10 TaxID=3373255 RepID=UPI003748434A
MPEPTPGPALELRGITAGYDRRAPVLHGVSLAVGDGEAVGLLGPSGCGKSTLARVAALLHRPQAGTVRLAALAASVGLGGDLLARRPHEVSDGQLQRACLARALVLRPRLLVCDEMTAMLDASTAAALVAAVEEYRREHGTALLAVGHDRVLLERWCGRTVDLEALPRR